uniref:Telomerase activating protein est1 n=1 Tax=Moniliophthora roreri TaxID=221103 RepID=A0A0W0GCB1_MONRR
MADQPSTIAREAKSINQSVKELLKNREPFDKELDFQRKNLRRRYLSLLLVHPYANESKDAETRLWMETSHAFIASYKQRISHLDRAIQRQQHQRSQQGAQTAHQNQRGHGPVEHRKIVQRFRQFLAEEEKFWTQLVVRLRRSFDLNEAHQVLVNLKLITEDIDNAASNGEPLHNGGRNHFQFPPLSEDPAALIPKTDAQRESRMETLSKALTCLGDIARYREQYNEAGGRPKAGYEDHSGPGGRRARSRRGGGRGGAEVPIDIPRPRNYEKAKHCYEQAKLLVPHEGNPSHQLAILASYQKDMFTSLVHYYRALCVRHPYDSASENIHTVLHKALEQLNAKRGDEAQRNLADEVPKIRIEAFKKRVVALHALYRVGLEENDALTNREAREISTNFYTLVSERHLPDDFIVQVIILSQAALWKHRMIRDTPKIGKNGREALGTDLPSAVIEARLFTHVLSLHRALLEVGIEQLREPAPLGPDDDLAQRIVVEFRRTLPALRIASKWLLANFKLVMQDPESLGIRSGKGRKEKASNGKTSGRISATSSETITFWEKYAEFLRALARAFPMNKLPDLPFPLAEDIEMRGFLPLRGMLDWNKEEHVEKTGTNGASQDVDHEDVPTEEKEVHPNVLLLMRIKDLLKDAMSLIEMENSPLALYGNRFMLKGVEAQAQPVPFGDPTRLEDLEDDTDDILNEVMDPEQDSLTEATSNDDPIREAFKHLDEGDEEDKIVWDPRASPVTSPLVAGTSPAPDNISPVSRNPGNASPVHISSPRSFGIPTRTSPPQQPVSPQRILPSQSPTKPAKRASPMTMTTAEDLLNGFMNRDSPTSRTSTSRTTSDPLASSTPLLFGGDRPGSSIWSASEHEQASMRIAASNPQLGPSTSPQVRAYNQPHLPHDVRLRTLSQGQSSWSHSDLTTSVSHPLPSHFAQTPSMSTSLSAGGQHRRVPSSSVTAQLFPDLVRNPGISDFGYGDPIQGQQIIHDSTESHLVHPSYTGTGQRPPFGLANNIYDSASSHQPNYEMHGLVFVLVFQALSALGSQNPIKASDGSDPFMVYHEGYYYLTTTTWNNIQLTRATTIAGLKTATPKVIWTDSTSSRQSKEGSWYIYYTAGTSGTFDNQRLHVLKGSSNTIWDSTWSYAGMSITS